MEKSQPSSDRICLVGGNSFPSGSRQLGVSRRDPTAGDISASLNTQSAGRSAGTIHRSGVRPFNRPEADTLTRPAINSSPFHTVESFICPRWRLPLPHGTAGEMVDSNTRPCHQHGRRNGAPAIMGPGARNEGKVSRIVRATC